MSLAACVVGAACGSDGGSPLPPGTITVLLTDVPAPLIAAVVTISRVDLVDTAGTATVLSQVPSTLDLITLAGIHKILVDEASTPAGAYAGLRFVISGGYVQVKNTDGSSSFFASVPGYPGLPQGVAVAGPLNIFDAPTTGAPVDFPMGGFGVTADTHVVLVDFDVAKSFSQQAGQSSAWAMHPFLTATLLPQP